MFRPDARRTGRAACTLSPSLAPAWTRDLGGGLTQATIAGGWAFLANRDTYELLCLNLADGTVVEKGLPRRAGRPADDRGRPAAASAAATARSGA